MLKPIAHCEVRAAPSAFLVVQADALRSDADELFAATLAAVTA